MEIQEIFINLFILLHYGNLSYDERTSPTIPRLLANLPSCCQSRAICISETLLYHLFTCLIGV